MKFTYRIVGTSAFIEVKASPNASKTEIAGVQDGRLRIRVAAAPENGKANAEIKAFFSKLVGCPKSSIEIAAGEKSKLKTVSMPAECAEKLSSLTASVD